MKCLFMSTDDRIKNILREMQKIHVALHFEFSVVGNRFSPKDQSLRQLQSR